MKHCYYILLSAICAVALSSCQKEMEAPDLVDDGIIPPGYVLEKLTGKSDATKTTVDDGETLWAEGDQIKVICSDNSVSNFTLQDGAGTSIGDFQGLVPEGKTAVYAVYPAARYSAVNGSTVKVTIPASQTGVFGEGNLAVAKVGSDNNMSFKNVNAFISFTIPAEITKVVISSVNGSDLGGTLSVDCSGSYPVAGAIEDGVSEITTTFPNANGGTYYIAVAPGVTHANGLLLKYFKGSEESGSYYLNKTIVTAANTNIPMGAVEVEGNYYVTVSGAGNKNGMSWADAFSAEQMWKKLHLSDAEGAEASNAAKIEAIDGAVFHLAAGNYNFGNDPTLSFSEDDAVTFTLKGGYNASTGERNLTANATNIIGGRDDNADPVTGHICLKLRGNMNISLDGLVFTGGLTSSDKGGALNCANNTLFVTMTDCVVSNNKNILNGADKNGAGLYLDEVGGFEATRVTFTGNQSLHAPALYVHNVSGNVIFNDCVFENNSASSWGGAARIRVGSPTCVFNNCSFNGNSAAGDSGCMVLNDGSVTLNNCTLSNNTCTGNGGAITINSQCALDINGGTFSGNEAAKGGVIFVGNNASTINLDNAVFNGNSAVGDGTGDTADEKERGNGGVIYSNGLGGTINIKGCEFSNNDAGHLGGAIYTPNNTNSNTISIGGNSTFSENHAAGWAGAIHFKCVGSLIVTDCTFSENYSDGDSGAFNSDNASATFTFSRVDFSGNHADGDAGGAMWISKGTYNFTDCTFSENYTSASGGGAVYANDTGTYSFTGCEFLGNYTSKKDKLGGAVYMKLADGKTATMTFTDCTFDGNEAATGYGGAMTVDGGGATLNIKGGSLKNGFARHGGAILARNNGNLIIERNASSQGTLFSGNHANNGTEESHGGAIAIEGKNAEFTCTGATFRENYLDYVGDKAGYGGAIAIRNNNGVHANIVECVFEGNYTACNGGSALSYQSSSGESNGDGTGYMRVIGSRFEGNHVDYNGTNKPNETGRHGGAVRLGHDATTSYFDGCTFIGNYTETPNANRIGAYGGAINYYADGMCYINNCYFEGNRAARGGAISAKGCPVSGLYLNGCSFSGNWNSYGGGTTIVLDKVQKFCMNNCSFNDNTYTSNSSSATEQGSWVYADGDSAETDPKMEEVVVSNCTAIGTCCIPNANTEATASVELLYFRRFASGGKMYLINNCLINTTTKHDAWWTNAVDLYGYYNVFNTAGRTGGNIYLTGNHNSGYYNDKSSNPPTYNNRVTKADLQPANIAWNTTNHVWPWNGGLANSKVYEKLTASDYDSLMSTASADFYAWLQNVDPKGPTTKNMLHTDQLGNNRGSGNWRPGAYQY